MKKILFVGLLATLVVACKGKNTPTTNTTAPSNAAAATIENGVKIAFYVLDTVAEKFDVYKEESGKFEKEGAKLQEQLASMQREYERVYTEYESGAKKQILTPNQMAGYEQKLGLLQQQMQEFQSSKMTSFQQRQLDATTAIQNKIIKYSEDFSKENNIDLFLISGAGGQVAYGNPSMDVTDKFVAFMNEKEKSVGK
ncbi:MAG: OmpH family outer membrane protein [Crocinitomicaceae bacterium]|nr:OmpH family outer membrane protein [Crocinitomicaceae bacterium]